MNKRRLVNIGLIGLSIALCWFFPLFQVRPLGGKESKDTGNPIVTPSSADRSTSPILSDYVRSAVELVELCNAFDADASKAKERYGRRSGLGGGFHFCVRGEGMVESIDDEQAVLSVDGSPRRVRLELGPIIGNTVREAVSVKASEFKNSQEFNSFASQLNLQVEQQVISPNRDQLQRGTRVQFVGCAKINSKSELDPLRLVPIEIKTSPR